MPKAKTKSTFSIEDKWGKALLDVTKWRKASLRIGGFVPVPRAYLRLYAQVPGVKPTHRKLTPVESMLILHIVDSKWDKGPPRVKTSVLARRMGISQQQIKKYIRKLKTDFGIGATYNAKTRDVTFELDEFFDRMAAYAVKRRAEKDSADYSGEEQLND